MAGWVAPVNVQVVQIRNEHTKKNNIILLSVIYLLKTGLTDKELYKGKCPVGIYMLKVNNRNTRTISEICSKLTIKTPEQRQWRRSGVFFVNF